MPDKRDEQGFPTEGVLSLGQVDNARDRKIIELYEGDPNSTTATVGKVLGISDARVGQRLDHWLALGVDLPKWQERRRSAKDPVDRINPGKGRRR